MKEYCVDLEIAKKLKENGFPQKCYFYYWNRLDNEKSLVLSRKDEVPKAYLEQDSINNLAKYEVYIYSAPTSDEILKELPKYIERKDEANIKILRLVIDFTTTLAEVMYGNDYVIFREKKLPNALAKMWLYLKKEGYIK